jgi:hypothetical protein
LADYPAGLLTSIDFTWNGNTYNDVNLYPSPDPDIFPGLIGTQATSLTFDATGELSLFKFGNFCGYDGCAIGSGAGRDLWWIGWNWMENPGMQFLCGLGGEPGPSGAYGGNVAFSPAAIAVPEPATLSLLVPGLALVAVFYRRRRLS